MKLQTISQRRQVSVAGAISPTASRLTTEWPPHLALVRISSRSGLPYSQPTGTEGAVADAVGDVAPGDDSYAAPHRSAHAAADAPAIGAGKQSGSPVSTKRG